jgi:hypothetical protein
LFADHDDPEQWHNVLRINKNGIGFSSNGGQTYTQAWTLDGKLVIGGTNVPELTVYTSDNVQTRQVLFKVSRAGIEWNLPNSTLLQDGSLKVKNVEVDKGYLRIVNPNYESYQEDPSIYVEDANYPPKDIQYIVEMGYDGTAQTIDGISWVAINSQLTKDGRLLFMDSDLGVELSRNHIGFKSNGIEKAAIYATGNGMWQYAEYVVFHFGTFNVYDSINQRYNTAASGSISFYDKDGIKQRIDATNGIVTYIGLDI